MGERKLLSIKDLSLSEGPIALVGRNGAGKSTFLRTIMGEHQQYSGQILINGKPIDTLSRVERAKLIAIVYSKSTIFGNHSGREVLMLGRLPYQNVFSKSTADDHKRIDQVIEQLKLQDFVDRKFSELSDGEKQLIMIGRALVQDTDVILLDEPGAFLDLVNRHRLMEVFVKISSELGKLVVFSTHDINFLDSVCKHVLLIEKENLIQLEESGSFIERINTSFGLFINSDKTKG